MSANSRICVAVRKRPMPADVEDTRDVVDTASPHCIVNEPKIKYDLTPYTDRHTFTFDMVFADSCNNAHVYESCCLPLIDTVFSNGNATCFAYGQTGSGKTHTMLGSAKEPGLYAIAARDIFARASNLHADVYVSLYEIYGRKIFDLLNNHERLFAREDADKVINICGLSEHRVTDVANIFDVITAGSAYRAAGVTSANNESSRSHAVLQIEVRETRSGGNGHHSGGGAHHHHNNAAAAAGSSRTIGRISFIDLAGNERGADTFDCDRKTRMEGAEINKSLLALKECIRALGMGKRHVPFRGSILTEVLRDSFTGNSRTAMIATISPTAHHCVNTLNTLRYTQRVKDLGCGPDGAARVDQVTPTAQQAAAGRRATPGVGAAGAVAGAAAAGNNNNNNNNARRRPFEAAPPLKNRPEWVSDFADVPLSPTNNNNNNTPLHTATSQQQQQQQAQQPPTTTAAATTQSQQQQRAPSHGRRSSGAEQRAAQATASTAKAANAQPSSRSAAAPSTQQQRGARVHARGDGGKGDDDGGDDAVVKVRDPKIATIVKSHIAALRDEAGDDDDDDDDDDDVDDEAACEEQAQLQQAAAAAGGGASPPAVAGSSGSARGANGTSGSSSSGGSTRHSSSLPREEERQVRKVHAYVVDEIAKAEEKLVALHRRHIDAKMTGIKEEIRAIQTFEDTDAVDEYVNKVHSLLQRQREDMDQIVDMLAKISRMLKDEEDLSNTLSSSKRVL